MIKKILKSITAATAVVFLLASSVGVIEVRLDLQRSEITIKFGSD